MKFTSLLSERCLHCVTSNKTIVFSAGARLPSDQLRLHPCFQGAEEQRWVLSCPLFGLLQKGTVHYATAQYVGKERSDQKCLSSTKSFSLLLCLFSSGMFFSLAVFSVPPPRTFCLLYQLHFHVFMFKGWTQASLTETQQSKYERINNEPVQFS